MSRPLQVSFVIAGALVCFGAGAWYAAGRSAPATAAATRRVLYYRDPMHPAYRSDRPGIAPDCGMELEPVYADDPAQPSPQTPGTVRIGLDKQQLIGIRTVTAERTAGERTLRTVGRVAADETRIYRLTAAVDGWILNAYSKVAGDLVTKGEPLLTYYTREIVGAEQAYLFALDSLDRFEQAGPVSEPQKASLLSQLRQATDQLLNLGMSERQIADVARQRKVTQDVILLAPANGYILARNVALGLRFDRGLEFYRVADLDHIWVFAEIFESESRYLRPGATAVILWQGRKLHARMAASPLSLTPPRAPCASASKRITPAPFCARICS